jgi:CRISPR/Cas system-associated endoribonuclease Cas2
MNYYNETLQIYYDFNEKLEFLNNNIAEIIFVENYHKIQYSLFNKIINKYTLPKCLYKITFGHHFNQKINKIFPKTIHTIVFGSRFNHEIKEHSLPKSLHTLTFNTFFNKKLKVNSLPKYLNILTFGYDFNKKINKNILPKYLKILTFGFNFNKKLNNALPEYLEKLTFGNNFNQLIKKNVLPNSLHTLIFNNLYNKKIKKNVLPNSLRVLNLGWNFNNDIILPSNLIQLSITNNNNVLINNLPLHLEILYISFNLKKYNNYITNLPFTLKEIVIKNENYINYIKIPFGCKLTVKNF